MAEGVVFLPSYHEAIRDLPDEERLQAYDAIVRYGLYGEITEMTPVMKALFSLIKPNIDASQRRYRAAKENGGKGGRPTKNQTENQKQNQKQNQTENQDIDYDIDSDFDSDKERERESRGETAKPGLSPEEFDRRRNEGIELMTKGLSTSGNSLEYFMNGQYGPRE